MELSDNQGYLGSGRLLKEVSVSTAADDDVDDRHPLLLLLPFPEGGMRNTTSTDITGQGKEEMMLATPENLILSEEQFSDF
ncbi:hypothetical protein CDL15_Pgr002220 [Punica granatum]|uniref:Uncharacterized protein n=1 Tax=Punica granatum TaxID=22663 RepID=A0A218XBP6_PUNGR|nr:hypothetical protein CDL15_Pgr002220 [Punica granatum]